MLPLPKFISTMYFPLIIRYGPQLVVARNFVVELPTNLRKMAQCPLGSHFNLKLLRANKYGICRNFQMVSFLLSIAFQDGRSATRVANHNGIVNRL